jgi:hypothetical protein
MHFFAKKGGEEVFVQIFERKEDCFCKELGVKK